MTMLGYLHPQWMASHCPTAHFGQWCLSGDVESKLQNGKEIAQIANGMCVGGAGENSKKESSTNRHG